MIDTKYVCGRFLGAARDRSAVLTRSWQNGFPIHPVTGLQFQNTLPKRFNALHRTLHFRNRQLPSRAAKSL